MASILSGQWSDYAAAPSNGSGNPENSPDTITVKQESPEESSYESTHTSPSSTSTPEPSWPNTPPHPKSEPDDPTPGTGDLENLDAYIPVGVLKRPISTGDAEYTPADPVRFPAEEIKKLEAHNWVRTRACAYDSNPEWCYVQVYVLPDDVGRRSISRSSSSLRRALKVVMEIVDRSPEAWEGRWRENEAAPTPDRAEEESLWYIFNTLQDPVPRVEAMREPYARRAMEELLVSSVAGLRTPLYPYQSRSAATMVQREVQPLHVLDPRLQTCYSPNGQIYYHDKEDGCIVREKRLYSEACGGILAETMGCGKTLICLALILATRGHFPRIPTQYQQLENPVRPKTASLVEMAAALAGRLSLPWRSRFERLSRRGALHARCIRACENNCGAYIIPSHQTKYEGRSAVSFPRAPPRHIRLCSGTLIVTPPNLVDHWQHEIELHTEGLKVLILRNRGDEVPSPDVLMQYDIVLFSRARFEKEAGEFIHNRRITAPQDDSPVLKLHWLRIIVDEGHNVAGSGNRTTMVHLLDQLCVERRWAVSGTPSSGLYGVEVSLASQDNDSDMDLPTATMAVLRGRKKTGSLVDNDLNDIDKLRYVVIHFLDLKPWSNPRSEDPASWIKYMMPFGKDGKRSKAQSLRATLQSIVIRHRMDVIHSEIPLPKLHKDVAYLEPTFFDKLNLNLFIFIIAVNAVTSERRDQDYMFHPRNRKHLSRTISNLRQAGFWWAGSEADMAETINTAGRYMEKNWDKMSEADRATLTEGIAIARKALDCKSWNAFRHFSELGIFVDRFPSEARSFWTLNSSSTQHAPLLLGISQARQAQQFVTSHLGAYDPAEGLSGAGIRARRQLEGRGNHSDFAVKKTIPNRPAHRKSPKKSYTKGLFKGLPAESRLKQTEFVATASAKLSYLLDRVQELHQAEKIIIFYDNNNSAFWIAEGLELLGIDFRIYANTLKSDQRTAYLALFRESEEVRVLLMDLRQASHGLHLANASRIFIINPIWDPNIESQAIKRAHRIGQTRPVYVETLVLENTLEDRILKRRKEMSDMEIQHAEKDLLDDSTMSTIIQNERFIPMPESEESARVRFLRRPAGFFDRHKLPIPDPGENSTGNPPSPSPGGPATPQKRKQVAISFGVDSSPESEPLPKRQSVGPSSVDMTPIRSLFGGPRGASECQQEPMAAMAPFSLLD